MGGQACVFHSAAEFSRDADLVIVAQPENLERLRAVLSELEATRIFVPELTEEYLRRAHAVHFRCSAPEANRIDLLARAIARDSSEVELALSKEQALEQKRDKEYWQPLREELEKLRRACR
jgi:hypothetical protein